MQTPKPSFVKAQDFGAVAMRSDFEGVGERAAGALGHSAANIDGIVPRLAISGGNAFNVRYGNHNVSFRHSIASSSLPCRRSETQEIHQQLRVGLSASCQRPAQK
jgi:hypothetical protein